MGRGAAERLNRRLRLVARDMWGWRGRNVRAPTWLQRQANQDSHRVRPDRKFPIAYREQIGNKRLARSRIMLILDPPMVVALAAVISSLSAFIWAVRRKP